MTTSEPAGEAERLIKSGCFEMTIEGIDPPDSEGRRVAEIEYEKWRREREERMTVEDKEREEAIDRRMYQDWVSYMKSVGVDNPIATARDKKPFAPLGSGPTRVNVTGMAYSPDGSVVTTWVGRDATSVKDAVQRAIDAGSTTVLVGVVEWGLAEWGNATAGAWKNS
jgi:hypothetical protein